MFRIIFVFLLAVGIAGGVAWYTGLIDEYRDQLDSQTAKVPTSSQKVDYDYGDPLYASTDLRELSPVKKTGKQPLPIDNCTVVVHDTESVSSTKEGHILFIGQYLSNQDRAQAEKSGSIETKKIFDGEKEEIYTYRPLNEGDTVEPGQIVAMIDPSMALHEVKSKAIKRVAAEADYTSSAKILIEAQKQVDQLRILQSGSGNIKIGGAVSLVEISQALVAFAKYQGEEITKKQGIKVAETEENQAKLDLSRHLIKCQLDGRGIVKKIYKFSGEGVKPQETIMELQNISQLRIEGSVESQNIAKLRANITANCYLEPSIKIGPMLDLTQTHRGEVTCVGFFPDGEYFVSGSEDHTVCVWKRGEVSPVMQPLPHASAVRSLVCCPDRVLVVGCADGTLMKWDLKNPSADPVKFNDQHGGAVTALAVSPDGKYIASGGEDNAINLWVLETGELLYPFDSDKGVDDPHQGTITALNFTPQCKLVSAARDNTIRVWALHQKGAKMEGAPIANRGGTVNNLGVSSDGRYMLFDKGKALQLVNVANHATECVLDTHAGSNPFDTLALLSPLSAGEEVPLLTLTGGAGDGRLQLWKTPTRTERAYQVRELVTNDLTAITSAAFAPAGSHFAVTGSKDGHVHLWRLPNKQDIDNQRITKDANNEALHIRFVDAALDASKARVVVYIQNPNDRLMPGQRVTLVVELPRDDN